MKNRLTKIMLGVAALTAFALGGAALATGAGTTSQAATTSGTGTTARPARTPETPLTGDVLAKVKAAAAAATGGTVDSATAENDSTNAAAVYEAHVTKADGTHVTVIFDKSYNVLATQGGRPGGRGFGHGGPGNGEAPLTGDVATQAKAAAVAKVGGTADLAATETDSSNSAAAYEVHVTKADGTHATVILDKSYNVLTVETGNGHGGQPLGG